MKKIGGFICMLLLNMLLNIYWSIPALLLLVAHFVFNLHIIYFYICLAVWIFGIVFWMLFVGFGSKVSGNREDEYRENKNPYSVGVKNKD